jgi:enterochelin esterase family protein
VKHTVAALGVASGLLLFLSLTVVAQQAPAGRRSGPLVSPEVEADRRVTFRLRAPNAEAVSVAISGLPPLATHKDEAGVWSVTTDPMPPDIYTYAFRVDGAAITDPSNREFQTSFGSAQSMFSVPGPQPWLPKRDVPRGAVARHVFQSGVAGDEREYFVYTPATYDPRRPEPYPVLFLLHGLGDDAGRWVNGGAAHVILDNLIAAERAVPMVLVTTLGYGTALGPAGARGPTAQENITGYTRILMEEVLPRVERGYHVSRNRERRAIAGLSMGGMETLYTAANHLDTFAWIASFSGAFVMWPGAGIAPPGQFELFDRIFPGFTEQANDRIRMLWIACGTDDGLIAINRSVKQWLTSRRVRFTEEETPDMGHVWPLWRRNLADLVPRLFR